MRVTFIFRSAFTQIVTIILITGCNHIQREKQIEYSCSLYNDGESEWLTVKNIGENERHANLYKVLVRTRNKHGVSWTFKLLTWGKVKDNNRLLEMPSTWTGTARSYLRLSSGIGTRCYVVCPLGGLDNRNLHFGGERKKRGQCPVNVILIRIAAHGMSIKERPVL